MPSIANASVASRRMDYPAQPVDEQQANQIDANFSGKG
jgi:hypothetical protein